MDYHNNHRNVSLKTGKNPTDNTITNSIRMTAVDYLLL